MVADDTESTLVAGGRAIALSTKASTTRLLRVGLVVGDACLNLTSKEGKREANSSAAVRWTCTSWESSAAKGITSAIPCTVTGGDDGD
jgi:hypothetical protein